MTIKNIISGAMMKAGVVTGVGRWEYLDIPVPELTLGKVLVRTKQAGICSTDVLRSYETGFYHYPIVPGHEFCGIVEAIAEDVSAVKVGDRVAVYPLIACGACYACSVSKPNLCDTYDFLGSRSHGGYAELVLCPEFNLVKIPDAVPFNKAAMTEPTAVALHGHRVAGTNSEIESVAIMGLGPIGLMVAQWAKVLGVKQVIGVDRNEGRLQACSNMGADLVLNSQKVNLIEEIQRITKGLGTSLVFECSGAEVLQQLSIMACRKGGQIVILGNPLGDYKLQSAHYSAILRREITIKGSWSSQISPHNEWREALEYMSTGKIDPTPLLSHQFKIADVATVMHDLYNRSYPYSRVTFNFE